MALVPFAELVNLFFGAAARTAFCAPQGKQPWNEFVKSERLRVFIWIIVGMFATTFVIFVLWKCLPCCRRRPTPPGGVPHGNLVWLFGHSTLAALTRAVFLIVISLLMVVVLTDLEIWAYNATPERVLNRATVCEAYIQSRRETSVGLCADLEGDGPWYNRPSVNQSAAAFIEFVDANSNETILDYMHETPGFVRGLLTYIRLGVAGMTTSLSKVTSLCLGSLVLVGIFLQPFFSGLFAQVLFIIGPTVLFMLSVGFVRWRVFSPVTAQSLHPFSTQAFDQSNWNNFLFWTYLADVLIVPFYQGIRGTMHRFYSISLQKAYFAKGGDTTWNDIKANMFCPFLILTGTVNDYVRVDDERAIHEISFSSLHTGSDVLGYVRARRPQSL
eukprot:CAMPEP_0177152164 /NCGR_PEP_ID=MMETSP0367-20130122/370_1 /TAXON_ID=447022 ORGANISM="Scrippsiella hangoei-like, Strain SHHI-4" /NCGR_SAMPLE_ID=MMETSP0367 /ASSEMBLY_ACC=CAM_ASM_000362 /LENGTH=385 /DNA_ID=CAMNT_0018597179 /DNA_START=108 /DNA_END=1262 /DNA_ORIENTATION=+